ncbi:hypothetical protein GCM10011369_04570 [Neiella marina]|uniref:Twin-arginine translocase subunit TatB n=1 Tax=Neiella marina TaxID=508461 RepID=A0A8J2U2E7_9GAMM|nr:Sec-independent protein translocase protein TatB [Neiella marina]GGA66121.1 hypothetical protein GCM10011369_04570 [Neiella marina]
MVDMGFWELALISIVGIIVVGPHRLPATIRSLLAQYRSAKQWLGDFVAKLEDELSLGEIAQQLPKQRLAKGPRVRKRVNGSD